MCFHRCKRKPHGTAVCQLLTITNFGIWSRIKYFTFYFIALTNVCSRPHGHFVRVKNGGIIIMEVGYESWTKHSKQMYQKRFCRSLLGITKNKVPSRPASPCLSAEQQRVETQAIQRTLTLASCELPVHEIYSAASNRRTQNQHLILSCRLPPHCRRSHPNLQSPGPTR